MCAPEDNECASDAELLQSWRSPGRCCGLFHKWIWFHFTLRQPRWHQPGFHMVGAQPGPARSCPTCFQARNSRARWTPLALWVQHVKHQAPQCCHRPGPLSWIVQPGAPARPSQFLDQRRQHPGICPVLCLEAEIGRRRAPRWLPRSCLQAAPDQSGVEVRFGPGGGLWGPQAVSEGGSYTWKGSEEGARASPPLAASAGAVPGRRMLSNTQEAQPGLPPH